MALNLWKIGGQPTSFNPLPSGLNTLNFKSYMETVVSFKAKSQSGKKLRSWVSGQSASVNMVTLTPEFKQYSFALPLPNSQMQFYIAEETNSASDIIIENIELVQKPLPKLTINGIDGFKSGKWALHANATVLDDETLELNATAQYQECTFILNTKPNTDYYFSVEQSAGSYALIRDNSGGGMAQQTANKTFKTGANTTSIKVILGNDPIVKVSFKKPMLNLGTTPAPYSRKTGDKMVLPVVKKNLLLPIANWNVPETGKRNLTLVVKPNTTYTFSHNLNTSHIDVDFYDGNTYLTTIINFTNPKTFTTTANQNKIIIWVNGYTSKIDEWVQLEQGSIATPYEPYAVQVNKKPLRYVPKKNLMPSNIGEWFNGDINSTTGAMGANLHFISTLNLQPIKPNTSYVATFVKGVIGSGLPSILTPCYYRRDGSFIQKATNITESGTVFVTHSEAYFIKFQMYYGANLYSQSILDNTKLQLEEGTTATPYEPYTQVLPRAKNGLSFNGTTDYLQLPSMTMDSIEIDGVFNLRNSGYETLVDARFGSGNVYEFSNGVQVGTGFTATGFMKNERTKLKLTASTRFTDDVTLFTNVNRDVGTFVKATLYKATCYLAGQVVATYDFENPSNIVGDKVLPKVVGVPGKNLFDKSVATLDYFITTTDGTTVSSAQGHAVSDFIPVKSSFPYVGSGIKSAPGAGVGVGMAFYTSSKTFISGIAYGAGASLGTFTTPANAAFVRFTFLKVDINVAQLEEGAGATAYEPFTLVPVNTKPNLIPSFEDSRWSLHANFKVLGKDVGRLEANGTFQASQIIINVPNMGGRTVSFSQTDPNGINRWDIDERDSSNNIIVNNSTFTGNKTWTLHPNTTFLSIQATNNVIGTFDFIKPQLYELSGKEGTLMGKPTPLRKASKRTLYRKR